MSDLLQTLDPDTMQPTRSRVKDASSLHDLYTVAVDADSTAAQNRAQWRAMVDGEAPYDQGTLDETGQGDRSNIDLGYGRAAIQQAEAGYYDLVTSVPVLMEVTTKFGTQEQRQTWQPIIAQGLTQMFRRWRKFEFNHQLLSRFFVEDGVSCAYFEDSEDWRYKVDNLENLKLPRGAEANEEDLEFAFLRRKMSADVLYRFIENEEEAVELGWDVDAVKELLLESVESTENSKFNGWEALQREIKNNDLWCSRSAKASAICVVHAWVKELDGEVSHYIIDDDGAQTDFLFKHCRRFKSMTQALKIFTYGIGNGDYHSIRGKGFEVYPYAQNLNRLGNSIIDGAQMSSAVLIQPTQNNTRALDDLALTVFGPFSIVPPGFSVIEKQLPNFANNSIPAVNLLLQQMTNNVGGYDTRATTADGQARTAYEVKAQLQKEAGLSVSAVDLFYGHWSVLMNESVRRICRDDYGADEPGGRQVADFILYCRERNVPVEAIYKIERVEPVRAVGAGSAAQRLLALDDAMQLIGSLDSVGRNNLLRDRMAARFGYDQTDRYLPRLDQGERPVVDAKIAILENGDLARGVEIMVMPNEDHFIHAQAHIEPAVRAIQLLSEGQMEPQAGLLALRSLLTHMGPHLDMLNGDVLRAKEVAQMRQTVQQLTAAAQRLQDQLTAAAEQQAKAEQAEAQRQATAEQSRISAMEQAAAEAAQPSPKTQAMLAETQARIETSRATAQNEIEISRAKALQELATKSAARAMQDNAPI